MKSTIRSISSILAPVASVLALVSGCSEWLNPWADDLPPADAVTTASVEGVRAADTERTQRECGLQRARIEPQDGTVVHWPLWWEDPFVDKGSEDGQDAWTEEDYLAIVYGLGRFLLNTMALPVSAGVTPPTVVMGSDGVLSRQLLGYDHDAERRVSGVAPPIDIMEVGTVPAEGEGSGVVEPFQPDADASATGE